MENQLDQDAYNLAKAIRKTETGSSANPYTQKGASGEFGAYQFMPTTYKNLAKKHLGDENAPMTVENQNKIAYSEIKALKDAGKTPAQIASIWNSGKADAYKTATTGVNSMGVKYDVPGYVAKVSQNYNELKGQKQIQQPVEPVVEEPKSNVLFPSNPNDSGLTAGLKALGNTPQSAYNFAKGAISSLNPLTTVKNIKEIVSGFKDLNSQTGNTADSISQVLGGIPKATYENLVPGGIRSAIGGDIEQASKQFTEDPFGQVAPVVLTALGGAKTLDNVASKNSIRSYVDNIRDNTMNKVPIPKPVTKYSDALDTGISTVGGAITKPISALVSGPVKLGSKIIKSATSQLIGLEPDSISNILANPKEYSKLAQEQVSRGNLSNEFGKAIDKVDEGLQETGSAYNPIRQNKTVIPLPIKFVESVLGEFGLKISKGKVTADANSITRNTKDLKALQNFYDNWGNKKAVNANEYLNMRKDIAGIAKFDKEIGTNPDAQIVGTRLYERGNEIIRPKIKGLKELDERFSPQKEQWNQIKKDFLQKDSSGDYVFKDGAINKISNAANKGKDALLARMEEVLPGITKKIQILKTVEDIQKAYGNKVGTYARGVLGGGSLLTGNVPGVIATIIANPAIAIPLLRGLGYTVQTVGPIVSTLKLVAGDINDFKLPSALNVRGIKSDSSVAKNDVIRNSLDSEIKSKQTQNKPNEYSNEGVSNVHKPSIPLKLPKERGKSTLTREMNLRKKESLLSTKPIKLNK